MAAPSANPIPSTSSVNPNAFAGVQSWLEDIAEHIEAPQSPDMLQEDEPIPDDEPAASFSHVKLLEFIKLYGSYNNFRVTLNCGEIIFMLLSYAVGHNLNQSATVDLLERMNTILNTDLFPGTVHKFQTTFNPGMSMELHSTCSNCTHYLGIKAKMTTDFTCRNCKTVNKVKGYKYENTFLTLNVEEQVKDFLDYNINDLKVFNENLVETSYRDIQSGSLCKKFNPGVDHNEKEINLTCTFNADGAPFADTKLSFTPLLLMVNEAIVPKRGKHLILAGLWYGKIKPRMDVFLEPFVEQIKSLSDSGMKYAHKNKIYKVNLYIICCCVDTIARSPMQGVKGVNGYYCCSWCLIEGKWCQGTVKYASPTDGVSPIKQRTEKSFRAACKQLVASNFREVKHGVQFVSTLIRLPRFKMVWGFVPDYMHCVLLGIVRRFLNNWMSNTGTPYYIGEPANESLMDKYISNIRPPKYVKRIPLPISSRGFMKAREAENWLLFYSVPVLQGIIPEKYYDHWLLLVGAVQLLIDDEVTESDIVEAEGYLELFVRNTNTNYGLFECTYNVHQLLHLGESVRRWGPLWSHTCFPFEAAIGRLKKVLSAFRGIPHQVVRRLDLIRSLNIMSSSLDVREDVEEYTRNVTGSHSQAVFRTDNNEVIFGVSKTYNGVGDFLQFDKVISKGVVYEEHRESNSRKFDNSFVILNNDKFCRIQSILTDSTRCKVFFVVEEILCEPVYPLKSTRKMIRMSPTTLTVDFTSEVKGPAVFISVNGECFVTAIPINHFMLNM